MDRLSIFLADDHMILLEGLKSLLAEEFDLVGTASDGREVLQALTVLNPDIVVLDITMPNLNGIETARVLRKSHPKTKLIILTMHSDTSFVRAAFEAGASGYLLKHSAPKELVAAINFVASGHLYVSPLISDAASAVVPYLATTKRATTELSAREREVLQLLAEGKVRKEIAAILDISVKTVEFHRHRINEKLGVHTVAELTAYAIRHGIVSG
jgi:DNA-binding NarL/FixJ family response regulator